MRRTADNDIDYHDDQSLQRAGANLAGVAPAIEDLRRMQAGFEAAKARFLAAYRKMQSQWENDLPSSSRLVAEIQAVGQRVASASTADELGAAMADAETLSVTYRREHETDEDRLSGGRGGVHRERRADVLYAEQDN